MSYRNEIAVAAHRDALRAQWAGPALMLSAALLFAVMDCLVKVLGNAFSVWDLAFYRFGASAAILLLCFRWDHNPFSSPERKLLIVRGLTGSAAFLALIPAIQLIPISTAMVLFYSYPAFAAIAGALFFKERITADLLWVVVTLAGIGVFLDVSLEGGLLGQILSLLGAAFAGVAVTTVRKARKTNGPVIIYLYFCVTGLAMAAGPFLSAPHVPSSGNEWLIIATIVGASLIAQLLMNEGFHYCGSFQGSLFMTSEVVFVSMWGIIFLNEPVTWHTWAGGAMIFTSIVALTRSASRRDSVRHPMKTEKNLPAHSMQ